MAYGSSLLLQMHSSSCIFEPAKLSFSASFGGLDAGASPPSASRLHASLAREAHIVGSSASAPHSSGNGALLLETQLEVPSLKSHTQKPCHAEEPTNAVFPVAKPLADAPRLGGLDTSLHSYRENFVIRCYEVGMNRTASIETIANLLQEVACDHAQSVGFSTDGFATTLTMRKQHLIWVTTRMHIEVDEYPVWGDVLQIETWCQSEGKVGTRRDWLMTDVATGKLIGRATSTWVMMNQDTRRLSRIPDDVREELNRYCPTFRRYAFPEDNSECLKKIAKLKDPPEYIRSGLMPRRGDLDMNQHVNNVTYIGWTLESMPLHLVNTHQLYSITLDYRRECKYDDTVESLATLEQCRHADNEEHTQSSASGRTSRAVINGSASTPSSDKEFEFLHFLRLAGSDVEINRGRTVWKRKVGKVVAPTIQNQVHN